jgi:hypothetical protein
MSSLGNLTLSGVSLTPSFIFGVESEISNHMHLIDDRKLLYIAGH